MELNIYVFFDLNRYKIQTQIKGELLYSGLIRVTNYEICYKFAYIKKKPKKKTKKKNFNLYL